MPKRVVVLVSGTGTLLQALLDESRLAATPYRVVAVGSDRPGIEGLRRAQGFGVPTFVHPFHKGEDRAVWDAELTAQVASFTPDLVVLAGFMKLVGPAFLSRFAGRTINTHPSLLPSFPGMNAPADALAHGVKVTGSTVFQVDSGVDSGRILAQEPVRIQPGDAVAELHERIKTVERRLLVDVVNQICGGVE